MSQCKIGFFNPNRPKEQQQQQQQQQAQQLPSTELKMAPLKYLASLSPLSSVLASPVPGFLPVRDRQLVLVLCNMLREEITDASYRADLHWSTVNTESALSAVANSWNSEAPGEGQLFLPFTMKVSNFFRGPEHMNCQDVGDGTRNTMVQCDDTFFPAGYLILNSFVAIHQVHQNRYNGLDSAMNQMQNSMGKFAETFAPQITDPSLIMREILSSFALAIGLGFCLQLEHSADLQNDLTEAMDAFVGRWMAAEADYANKIFSGAVGTLSDLHGLLRDGIQGAVPTGTDLATLKDETQKIVYTKMIPAAWKWHPASSLRLSSPRTTLVLALPRATLLATSTNLRRPKLILPGGTYDNFKGGAWGGVTLDDIVVSPWDEYKLNGNKNG
ncbi:hypothetical protein QQZ08_008516 [Neonectria magnoliae]|uniref:Uncharacterized protein n=1 Tax=Neonectria magnoliae TaxID=2732573 RepID=A0ABR1HTS3_9HYPO